MTERYVYNFGPETDGNASMKELLGGKGANLAEMARLGLPVPPGFTITTAMCHRYYQEGEKLPVELNQEMMQALAKIESYLQLGFGDPENPLLLSVRSGARASMPGMMDTVLNLGLNDKTMAGLAKKSGDARFAADSYRRFIQMFSNVVLNLDPHGFEDILDEYKRRHDKRFDTDLGAEDWHEIITQYKDLVQQETGAPFPDDPKQQLEAAICAVFQSWMNPRAKTYRKLHDIPESWGTAVNVQAMVFGNMGNDCGTGVAFTRNPSTGENSFYGEFLLNAQGEDVVAGIRTPQPLTIAAKNTDSGLALEEVMPDIYRQLLDVRALLEKHYRDMQDIEFTIQQHTLYMLQTRNGKRTAAAAIRIAVEMAEAGLISQDEAVLRIDPNSLDQLLHPTLDPHAPRDFLTRGLPASPGAASGVLVFDANSAEKIAATGQSVILCRIETSPEDIHGMHAARAILTSRGGMTSHAAVVARGMGRPCVCGAGELKIDYQNGTLRIADRLFNAGDMVTLDGSTGDVFAGKVATIQASLSGDFAKLMQWADASRRMTIRANAETRLDAETALRFGAEGIGLCRTEHMFFDETRIMTMRAMILADNSATRNAALATLEPMQRADFVELFSLMPGLPITIRLLDPPLHEFLPHSEQDIARVASAIGRSSEDIAAAVMRLHEANPMLGHRGCRLAVSHPEIYQMQTRAIIHAALDVAEKTGTQVIPEIMIPLIALESEMRYCRDLVRSTAEEILHQRGKNLSYQIGTMIELPRAALMAGEIAKEAEFFSFGTNDLTQTTLGLSRDDAANFLPAYEKRGLVERDPFATLDIAGVGQLMRMATIAGRQQRPQIKIGICGEHGGDPASIAYCEEIGLDYVSCSAYRVPIARLAAAQAALRHKSPPQRQAAA